MYASRLAYGTNDINNSRVQMPMGFGLLNSSKLGEAFLHLQIAKYACSIELKLANSLQ